jgi:hypothetical protein
MSAHDYIYQTFIIYLFIKAMIFLPLAWVAVLFWWSDQAPSDQSASSLADT